ncbi:CaiB/BaiF CoA transferase family protein [Frankia sp. AiPs1]|uniref:CaiB/BaiF CoA transferase family protein n=1 Tax=Frankia sp. AiPs1 TaxID=573493 RepID=UPI0035ABC57F
MPLSGVRVLDLTTGPLAAIGRHLAEWGADVLRVEPPGGAADRRTGRRVAGVSLGFAAANLGKRAVSLDLSRPADRERFTALLADADILLESTPPSGPEATTLDVEGIRREHPSLVVLSATPFGRTGPHAGWQATSPVLHALSGELSRSGIPGREPLLPPGDLPYDCAAAQAVFVVLLAYLERLRTGLGDHLDFAVLDGAVAALDPGYGIAGSATAGVPASKLPRGRPEARHQYPIIPCADGFVRLCILAPRQWRAMFGWMGRPAQFADPSYDKLSTRFASTTLLPAIARFFADKTRAELEQAGQRHGVPTAAVLDLAEALDSEQVRARGAFTPVELAPGISAPFPNGVLELDGHRAGIRGPAPTLPPDSAAARSWATRPAPAPAPAQAQAPISGPTPGSGDAAADPGGRPLAGLRVLDLGVIVVGAEQGRLLADQGADVIKVENNAFPDGSRQARDGSAITVTFAAGHRNKRSLGLDLRSPRGRDLFLRLVADTDVVLTNYRPGTLESLGLGYDVLGKANPAVIVVDSSAFGSTGPWSRRLGYGPLVRACAGLTAQWRYPGEADGFSDALTVYPDHVAARIGIAGVLALLIRRRRTGTGGTVSVSQTEVMLGHTAATAADKALLRAGAEVDGPTGPDAPWGVFPTAGDDDWCVVTVRGNDDWQALCRVLGRPDLATEPALTSANGRAGARDRIDAALTDWLAQHSVVEAMTRLQAAGIPAGAMLRVSELPSFPYYAQRGVFRLSGHPHIRQTFYLENAPVHSDRLPDPPDNPAPLLGEHTEQILRAELGLTDAETAELLSADDRIAGASR